MGELLIQVPLLLHQFHAQIVGDLHIFSLLPWLFLIIHHLSCSWLCYPQLILSLLWLYNLIERAGWYRYFGHMLTCGCTTQLLFHQLFLIIHTLSCSWLHCPQLNLSLSQLYNLIERAWWYRYWTQVNCCGCTTQLLFQICMSLEFDFPWHTLWIATVFDLFDDF